RPDWKGMAPDAIPVVERALRRALSMDPSRRPGSAGELVEGLRAWLASDLPEGTLTFLLTDVEGSTRAWEDNPDAMSGALAAHDEAIGDAVARHRGRLIKSKGEGD